MHRVRLTLLTVVVLAAAACSTPAPTAPNSEVPARFDGSTSSTDTTSFGGGYSGSGG